MSARSAGILMGTGGGLPPWSAASTAVLGRTRTLQTGSHIRLTTEQNGQHHITIPNHDPLKVGTLSAIITDIAEHFNKTKDQLLHELFG